MLSTLAHGDEYTHTENVQNIRGIVQTAQDSSSSYFDLLQQPYESGNRSPTEIKKGRDDDGQPMEYQQPRNNDSNSENVSNTDVTAIDNLNEAVCQTCDSFQITISWDEYKDIEDPPTFANLRGSWGDLLNSKINEDVPVLFF
jgi:hypothetical protein